jgi:hypothetical protein
MYELSQRHPVWVAEINVTACNSACMIGSPPPTIIDRGPGFLAVMYITDGSFPPPPLTSISSTSDTLEDWERETICWRGTRGGAKSYDSEKAWFYKSFNTLCSEQYILCIWKSMRLADNFFIQKSVYPKKLESLLNSRVAKKGFAQEQKYLLLWRNCLKKRQNS